MTNNMQKDLNQKYIPNCFILYLISATFAKAIKGSKKAELTSDLESTDVEGRTRLRGRKNQNVKDTQPQRHPSSSDSGEDEYVFRSEQLEQSTPTAPILPFYSCKLDLKSSISN
jgi:hypothetical protein